MGVPAHLRPYIGRSELSESLGPARTSALRRHHAIVAKFASELEAAAQKAARKEAPAPAPRPRVVRRHAERLYAEQVESDQAARTLGTYRETGLEPPRLHRRPFGLSHAAMAVSPSMA